MKKGFIIGLICIIACAVVGLTGCNSSFTKQDYDDMAKITQSTDRGLEKASVFQRKNGDIKMTASEFAGWKTLWKNNVKTTEEREIKVDLQISGGYAKVVFIDGDNKITVLAECSQDAEKTQSVTKTVTFTGGQNKLKVVGYDSKDLDVKILFDEP